jgi:hypothetical protein
MLLPLPIRPQKMTDERSTEVEDAVEKSDWGNVEWSQLLCSLVGFKSSGPQAATERRPAPQCSTIYRLHRFG